MFLGVLAFLWFVPELQGKYFTEGVAPENLPTLVNEYRKTWAQIIAGFFVLLGLYLTWRRVEISQKTLETQQDQQVTERFTRAIEQLGATYDDETPKLEIRLGGIYALERIAIDSPGRDYSTVIEVLTAYIRQHAPIDKFSRPPGESAESPPPTDIQAILDVLRRRWVPYIPITERQLRIDLRRTKLQNANLATVNFEKANLEGVVLPGANLEWAKLSGANLEGVNLERANLKWADLSGATLQYGNLQRAFLRESKLLKADFVNADLQRADLQGATLLNADFHDTDLMEANLRGVDFQGVVLLEADLRGADIRGADLRGAKHLTQK